MKKLPAIFRGFEVLKKKKKLWKEGINEITELLIKVGK